MKKGIVDIPIVFVGLLILAIIILIILTFFGFNLIGKVADLIMGMLNGIAGFFSNMFSVGQVSS